VEFFEHTHMRNLKVCFDSGHAHLDGGVEDAMTLLRGAIASTHLHDNAGARDEHMLPGEGKIDWEELIPALRRESEAVSLVLEARGSESSPLHLEKASAAADKLERIWEDAQV
jgi:sugar phosphate isomerase/epimerase